MAKINAETDMRPPVLQRDTPEWYENQYQILTAQGHLASKCHGSPVFECPVYLLGAEAVVVGRSWLCFGSYPPPSRSGGSMQCLKTVSKRAGGKSFDFKGHRALPPDFTQDTWTMLKSVGPWYHRNHGWGFYAERIEGEIVPAGRPDAVKQPRLPIANPAEDRAKDANQPEPYVIGEDMA